MSVARRGPRKISLASAAAYGHTWLRIHCETERKAPRRRSHGVNVCGHHAGMPIADAIARWGAETSLSELPLVCSVCGGRDYCATASAPPRSDPRR